MCLILEIDLKNLVRFISSVTLAANVPLKEFPDFISSIEEKLSAEEGIAVKVTRTKEPHLFIGS